MAYCKDELKVKFEESLKKDGWLKLYRQDFLNYTGKLKGSKIYYVEELAGFILENINELKNGNWNEHTSRESYKVEHDISKRIGKTSCRIEELEATEIKKQEKFSDLGSIIDFQTPLCHKRGDSLGKIDLLAYDDKTDNLRIIEFKREYSKETILRCIMEAYTYKRLVDYNKDTFLTSFGLPKSAKIIPTVLIYTESNAYLQYKNNDLINIKQLIKELGIEIYTISKKTVYLIKGELCN